MKRLVGLVGLLTIAGTLTAKAAGPVYTIPADYEKIKKVVEGLVGSDLNSVDPSLAKKVGEAVRGFVEGATNTLIANKYHNRGYLTYRRWGGNFRLFIFGATLEDPAGSYPSSDFWYSGNNIKNMVENLAGLPIRESRTYYFLYAGRNIRHVAEGLTGLSVDDSRYRYFRNAGVNYRTVAQGLANGQWIGTDPSSRYNNFQQYKVQQFKQRADQVFYDTYINSDGLRKAFTSLSSVVTRRTAGLTPIARDNKVSDSGRVVAYTTGTSVYIVDSSCYRKGNTLYCGDTPVASIRYTTYYFDDHRRAFYRLIPLNPQYKAINHYDKDGESVLVF